MSCTKFVQYILASLFVLSLVPMEQVNGTPWQEKNSLPSLFDGDLYSSRLVESVVTRRQNEDTSLVTAEYNASIEPQFIAIWDPFIGSSNPSFGIEDINDPNIKTYRERGRRPVGFCGTLDCHHFDDYQPSNGIGETLNYISPRDEHIRLDAGANSQSHIITGFIGEQGEYTGFACLNPEHVREKYINFADKDFDCCAINEVVFCSCDLSNTFITNSYIGYVLSASLLKGTYFEYVNFLSSSWEPELFKQTRNYELKELKYVTGVSVWRRSSDPISPNEKLDLSNFKIESVSEIEVGATNIENATISNSVLYKVNRKPIESTQSYKDKILLGNQFGQHTNLSGIDFTDFNLTGCRFGDYHVNLTDGSF